MIEVDELLLEHFGVKGMQWGVRKSPEEIQARRNLKAKKYEDKAQELQRQINKKKQQTWNPFRYGKINELEAKKQLAIKDAERKKQGKLSRREKQVAIGAAVAGVLVASYITYQSLNSGNARRLTEKGKDFVARKHGLPWKLKPELRDPDLDADGIMSKVVGPINKGYGAPGTKNNCRRATYAYEMRRRGYDVAATKTSTGRGQDITGSYNVRHPGVNLVPSGPSGIITRMIGEGRKGGSKPFTTVAKTPGSELGDEVINRGSRVGSRIVEAISRHPDGARGELGIRWNGGGGHSMAWEIVHGQPVLFDAQTGRKYVSDEIIDLAANIDEAGVSRLDNVPLNDDFLRRWLKHA